MRNSLALAVVLTFFAVHSQHAIAADRLLVEAESFDTHGGWKLDTQFIEIMGSPYLLAHGLGKPVADATTTVEFPKAGTYHVHVRTKDWVARWDVPGTPGRFQLAINGLKLREEFGTKNAEWHWHYGGPIQINDPKQVKLALKDLTGFAGRADAIYFTTDKNDTPPNESKILSDWRREMLGLPDDPEVKGPYDLVVVGGGYSGMGAAISAARQGIKVALIQNRPVLGGNGSSEVRVWAKGAVRRGKYPTIGEIIDELADRARMSPGTYEEFGDAKKEAIVRAEPNLDLYLNHHAYAVETKDKRIVSVTAFSTRDSSRKKFTGRNFVDCTGHGTIGALAGAEYQIHDGVKMGMSNMWRWHDTAKASTFPGVPWALQLTMKDFPYPRRGHGEWFWESGYFRDAIKDLEYTRDLNLRAVYGAFAAMKKYDADKHRNAELTWIAYIGGTRESRRIIGDVLLTEEDIVSKRQFPDGCVPSTWSIDLHYPKEQYAKKYPKDPFISKAVHGRGVDRNYGYPVPYRCFYSKDIGNLFMAGRCISVTHEALGTVRVMKTCGMMGEVVGKAAALCVKHDCDPRDVYASHWPELDKLLQLPGNQRRDTLDGEFYVRKDAPPLPERVRPFREPIKLPGIVVDDAHAKRTGKWTGGTGLAGYIGSQYLYASGDSGAIAVFAFKVPADGKYEVRVAHQPHENRSTKTPVTVKHAGGEKTVVINQRVKAKLPHGFNSLGVYEFTKAAGGSVAISANGADGNVHADAVQILPVK